MVLHIESSLTRRDAARLEARHRAADIDVGQPQIVPEFQPASRFRRLLFPFGRREIRTGGRIRKDQSGANRDPRASIDWQDLKVPAQIVNLVSTRIRNPKIFARSKLHEFLSAASAYRIVIAMIRSPVAATRRRGEIFPTFFPAERSRARRLAESATAASAAATATRQVPKSANTPASNGE